MSDKAVEVVGIDHIYLSVRSLDRSERFYDQVLLETLGFRKSAFTLGGDPHVQYYNRMFGIVLRPAHAAAAGYDPSAPGLHHLCFRVTDPADVDRAANRFIELGIEISAPRLYPEYAPDYYALFFSDPDGARLEITNFRAERRTRMEHWDDTTL